MSEYGLSQLEAEAANLTALVNHAGWKVLVDEASKRLDAVKDRLTTAPAVEVPGLQAQAQGLKFVLTFPEEVLRAWARANAEPSPSQDEVSTN